MKFYEAGDTMYSDIWELLASLGTLFEKLTAKDHFRKLMDMEYVELNDIYFNQNTALRLDDKAEKIVETIDGAKIISKFKIRSKFNDIVLDVDKLSAGCKTVLNVLYNSDKVFCLKECGNNALEILSGLSEGY